MEEMSSSAMVKHKPVNAFTLLEMMVVLFIVSIFSFSFYIPGDSLSLFMEKMMMYSITCQEKAFQNKEEVDVEIDRDYALFGDVEFDYPSSIHCSTTSFHYNSKGNISKAQTVSCTNGQASQSLVYQLGSGRVRIDE